MTSQANYMKYIYSNFHLTIAEFVGTGMVCIYMAEIPELTNSGT